MRTVPATSASLLAVLSAVVALAGCSKDPLDGLKFACDPAWKASGRTDPCGAGCECVALQGEAVAGYCSCGPARTDPGSESDDEGTATAPRWAWLMVSERPDNPSLTACASSGSRPGTCIDAIEIRRDSAHLGWGDHADCAGLGTSCPDNLAAEPSGVVGPRDAAESKFSDYGRFVSLNGGRLIVHFADDTGAEVVFEPGDRVAVYTWDPSPEDTYDVSACSDRSCEQPLPVGAGHGYESPGVFVMPALPDSP